MTIHDLDHVQTKEMPEMHPNTCRSLWAAVLAEQLRLATLPRPTHFDTELDIYRPRKWFGFRDFHMVCALAGLDGDWILKGYRNKMAEMQVTA
jgi:hypothetical protein